MHKHHTNLSVGGEFPLESDMVVDLSCPRKYSTRQITIQAYVVDKVCKDLQEQDSSQIRRMDFIQGKQLADPLMGESGQVDLLLDIADSYRCYLTNMASSANGELKAFETIFGWIVGGGTPSTLNEEAVCHRVEKNFYVDDFLNGSNSIKEAIAVQQDLTALLAKGKMSLRKWRTNSQALRDAIPSKLLETEPLQVSNSTDGCPKALGIHW